MICRERIPTYNPNVNYEIRWKSKFFVALHSQLLQRTPSTPPSSGFARLELELFTAKAFGDYQPTEHDVFVATFVKSGTNRMLQITQQIAHYGAAEFEHIHDVVPWPDAPMINLIPLTDPGPRMQSPTGLRIIKTHNVADCVPYNEKAKYITVIRDPKEAFVSSYYFLGGILGILEHVTAAEWFDLFMKDQPDLGRIWAVYTAGFWDWRER